MRCPFCLSENDKVVDSRSGDEGSTIRRRRECADCRRRYTTYERVERQLLTVVKKGAFERLSIVTRSSEALFEPAGRGRSVRKILSQ